MLKHLDHRPVPRGTSKWLDSVGRRRWPVGFKWDLKRQGVFQYGEDDLRHDTGEPPAGLVENKPHFVDRKKIEFIDFYSVEEHDDDWENIKYQGKECSPAFWHWVLRGEFTLYVGNQKKTFKKGDIFVMDMNLKHKVEAAKLCTTLVATVPKKLYRDCPVYRGNV